MEISGAHTAMVPEAYLYGIDTVREAIENDDLREFIESAIDEEIIPALDMDKKELERMGEWIHTHNTKTNLKDLNNYSYSPEFCEKILKTSERKINVYKRKNGDVGIRNELWIVPTVGCVNGIAQRIKEDLMREIGDLKIDNINVLTHNYGCSQLGEANLGEINFGLECGGSDGLSGITANPMLGEFSDYIVSQGGTTVLTEVPEMFGAETLLMKRCKNEDVFKRCVSLINDFKEYFIKNDQEIYENPSPGNKKGGITTLEDKSLGCTQKSGKSEVVDVIRYGETLKVKGLNLLSAPGNDLVATTALAAANCHMVLFTTGRGNPYGGYVPTVKISTNSELYNKKKRWIDFDAGRLVSEDITMDELLNEFID
ncbi:MAG: UxaA family hydrolase, partial [Cetobacterium sp.]|uniref:UxaA family hydrolase n=1 Tax=Cetobacterium sp. TaxID=2071632 RepID=UPI003F350449